MLPTLKWDGSDVGDLTEYALDIREPEDGKVGALLTLKDGRKRIMCFAWKYKDDIPLAIDELKPLFGLSKIGRHKCIVCDVKLLISKLIHTDENVFGPEHTEYLGDDYLDIIEETIVFRYIMGLITMGDFLWYRSGEVLSYKDTSITFQRDSSDISEKNIKTWFLNDRRRVCLAMKRLLNKSPVAKQANSSPTARDRRGRIVQYLRIAILDIVRRINDDLIPITVGIISRIQFLLGDLEGPDLEN